MILGIVEKIREREKREAFAQGFVPARIAAMLGGEGCSPLDFMLDAKELKAQMNLLSPETAAAIKRLVSGDKLPGHVLAALAPVLAEVFEG